MLKIGDFSQLGQVSVRTLRLYDELALLKPAAIDRFTDYRYYSVEQLPRLNRILALKDLGFSLEQIARLLNENVSVEQLQGMLMLKQAEITLEVQEAQSRLDRVAARLKQIEREGQLPQYEVVLKKVERQTIAAIGQVVPTVEAMPRYRCEMYEALYAGLNALEVKPLKAELAIYHNPEYTDQDIEMEAAVGVDNRPPTAISTRPGNRLTFYELPAVATMASVIHHGRFAEVSEAIIALYSWMGLNRYTTGGPYRELHLFGREDELTDTGSVLLEVQVPVLPLDSHPT